MDPVPQTRSIHLRRSQLIWLAVIVTGILAFTGEREPVESAGILAAGGPRAVPSGAQ